MKLIALQPVLRTRDIDGTIEFYRDMLGFNCDAFDSEEDWAALSRENVSIMLTGPNEHLPFDKPAFTGSLYFHADDVDELWQSLKDRVEVCYPIEDFDYGMREFAIYDNNGYLLQFGSEINAPEG